MLNIENAARTTVNTLTLEDAIHEWPGETVQVVSGSEHIGAIIQLHNWCDSCIGLKGMLNKDQLYGVTIAGPGGIGALWHTGDKSALVKRVELTVSAIADI